MGLYALNLDMTQGCRGQHAASELEHLIEGSLMQYLVQGRPARHAIDCNFRLNWRNLDGVSGLKPLHIGIYAVKKQIIEIKLFDELFAAIVPHEAQRAASSRSAGYIQGVQRSRKRTDVVGARIRNIADNVHTHRAHASQGDVGLHIAKLVAKLPLHRLLHFSESLAGD